jgi:hypothetical protein
MDNYKNYRCSFLLTFIAGALSLQGIVLLVSDFLFWNNFLDGDGYRFPIEEFYLSIEHED